MKDMKGKTAKYSRGFTLIELMVVISIIALLSSIVIASLHTTEAYAEDGARQESLHSVSTALELYNTANGHYPVHTTTQDISLQNMVDQDLAPYMPPLPANFSIPNENDYYVSDANGTGYELLVAKQTTNSSGGGSGGSGSASNFGCNSSDYTNYSSQTNNSAFCQGVNVSSSIWNSAGTYNPTITFYSTPLGTLSQGQTISLIWSSTNTATCEITQDTTGIFGGWVGGSMHATTGSLNNVTIGTVSHGGEAQSGYTTMTCFSGNLTGNSASQTTYITIQQ